MDFLIKLLLNPILTITKVAYVLGVAVVSWSFIYWAFNGFSFSTLLNDIEHLKTFSELFTHNKTRTIIIWILQTPAIIIIFALGIYYLHPTLNGFGYKHEQANLRQLLHSYNISGDHRFTRYATIYDNQQISFYVYLTTLIIPAFLVLDPTNINIAIQISATASLLSISILFSPTLTTKDRIIILSSLPIMFLFIYLYREHTTLAYTLANVPNIYTFITQGKDAFKPDEESTIENPQRIQKNTSGLHLGKDYRVETETHLLTIAGTGGGKTQGQVLPNLLDNPETSFFVIDPKGITAAKSAAWRQRQGHEIVIFNPYREQSAALSTQGFSQFQSFNPLANLDPENDNFSSDVRFLAEALIYDADGSGKHFSDAARGFVAFLIKYIVTQPGETKTFARLFQLVRGGIHYLDEQQIFEKAALSSCASVQDGWRRWATGRGEVVDAIATAETQLAFLDNPALCRALEGGPFNFANMKTRKMSIYLILPFDKIITEEVRFLRLLLLSAMSQLYRTEKGREVVIILDEFGNLGPLHMIKSGMGAIREYGVKIWPFLQSLKQLQELYPQGWASFIENASAISLFSVNSVETADYFNKRAGKAVVERITRMKGTGKSESAHKKMLLGFELPEASKGGSDSASENYSESKAEHWEDGLPVAEIYNLPKDQLLIFRQGRAMPDRAEKLAAWRDEPFKAR